MRIALPKRQQVALMSRILSHISVSEAARLCKLSERTIRDWKRAKFTIDELALKKLCRKTGVALPKNAKRKSQYWYTKLGSPLGGRAQFEKYGHIGGDPEYRIKKWREWWEHKGKFKPGQPIGVYKSFKQPPRSLNLAEFVGIVLGDGAINQYQIAVTLHSHDDYEYGTFYTKLAKELFDVPIGCHRHKRARALDYVISRKGVVEFCINELGMKRGNKTRQQVHIPQWIKQNPQYLKACIRGLVDTDGSVFSHRYQVNGKWYTYKKLAFTNRSKPILTAVFRGLKQFGMHPRITKNQYDVRLESVDDLNQYFATIGSHNSKHLKRYRK
jgi:hypothetical protein